MRDLLLGRSAGDRDYVVVGATPKDMSHAGYKPVGSDFPVFLHPQTGEEYALARTERKSGRGHRGFVFHAAPDVSLADDLRRRDLTMNAIAQDETGALTDPFGGQRDIADRILRHVSDAFVEDPLRVLRVARFAAMLPEFSLADETMQLMKKICADGELQDLTPERVWRELYRGLGAARPSRMFKILHECGALQEILPEVAALSGTPERLDYHPEGDSFIHTMMALDAASELRLSAAECFAVLLHDIGKAKTPPDILPSHHGHETRGAKLVIKLCQRLKTPRPVSELAVLACAEHGNVHNAIEIRPGTIIDLLARLDAYRRPQRAQSVLRVCQADFAYWPTRRAMTYPQGEFVRAALQVANSIDTARIAYESALKHDDNPQKIAEQIRQARIKPLRKLIRQPEYRIK